ncbi:MAG: hypothetical protein V3R49_03555, partial [Gammaproteobacteria bacterium]
KFLKKTDWACEKIEAFYLYEFKNLPRASSEQFLLSPRDRIIPEDQTPGEPAELSLDDAERLREIREKKSAEYDQDAGGRSNSGKRSGAPRGRHSDRQDNNSTRNRESESLSSPGASIEKGVDPWAKWKNKPEIEK